MKKKSGKRFKDRGLRNQKWDYGWNSYYFVTICTHNRIPFFGSIDKGILNHSDIGIIADSVWKEIPYQFNYAFLDHYIIMPDHMHGIILINNFERNTVSNVSNSDYQAGGFAGDKNPMLNQNLSRVIRWFKGCVSYKARKNNPDFRWQSLYHDQIIHNKRHLRNVRKYINHNVINWKKSNGGE